MPSTPRQARATATRPLKVGQRVRFQLGDSTVEGVIVEERGPLGVGGRPLFVVRVQVDSTDDLVFELPSDDMQAA